jgi:hypothetical protein
MAFFKTLLSSLGLGVETKETKEKVLYMQEVDNGISKVSIDNKLLCEGPINMIDGFGQTIHLTINGQHNIIKARYCKNANVHCIHKLNCLCGMQEPGFVSVNGMWYNLVDNACNPVPADCMPMVEKAIYWINDIAANPYLM